MCGTKDHYSVYHGRRLGHVLVSPSSRDSTLVIVVVRCNHRLELTIAWERVLGLGQLLRQHTIELMIIAAVHLGLESVTSDLCFCWVTGYGGKVDTIAINSIKVGSIVAEMCAIDTDHLAVDGELAHILPNDLLVTKYWPPIVKRLLYQLLFRAVSGRNEEWFARH